MALFVSSSEPNNYYYDLTVLSTRERLQLSAADGAYEGVRVNPAAHRESIEVIESLESMFDDARAVRAIAVPGLGCSLHGAASLARQVANVLDVPVIAPISSRSQQNLTGLMRDPFGSGAGALEEAQTIRDEPTGGDAERLAALLTQCAETLQWLLGYSRGGWVLAHALGKVPAIKRRKGVRIAIFGGVVDIDCSPQRLRQYLGEMDLVGSMHSSLEQPYQRLPFTGHHLNPALPGYIDLTRLLGEFVAGAD